MNSGNSSINTYFLPSQNNSIGFMKILGWVMITTFLSFNEFGLVLNCFIKPGFSECNVIISESGTPSVTSAVSMSLASLMVGTAIQTPSYQLRATNNFKAVLFPDPHAISNAYNPGESGKLMLELRK
jgi:hypothetical protein